MVNIVQLPPTDYQIPNTPEFPIEVCTDWRFMIALCAGANAVAFTVQAFFEGQLLFAGGFVFLGLGSLFGIYYLFQARALEGHITHLRIECETKQQSIDRLTQENVTVRAERMAIQDQSKEMIRKITEWYNKEQPLSLDKMSFTEDPSERVTLLGRIYYDLDRSLKALTSKSGKKAELERLEKEREQNSEKLRRLEQSQNDFEKQVCDFEKRKEIFHQKQAQFANALQNIGLSAENLQEISKAVGQVAQEVAVTTEETAASLDIPLQKLPSHQREERIQRIVEDLRIQIKTR